MFDCYRAVNMLIQSMLGGVGAYAGFTSTLSSFIPAQGSVQELNQQIDGGESTGVNVACDIATGALLLMALALLYNKTKSNYSRLKAMEEAAFKKCHKTEMTVVTPDTLDVIIERNPAEKITRQAIIDALLNSARKIRRGDIKDFEIEVDNICKQLNISWYEQMIMKGTLQKKFQHYDAALSQLQHPVSLWNKIGKKLNNLSFYSSVAGAIPGEIYIAVVSMVLFGLDAHLGEPAIALLASMSGIFALFLASSMIRDSRTTDQNQKKADILIGSSTFFKNLLIKYVSFFGALGTTSSDWTLMREGLMLCKDDLSPIGLDALKSFILLALLCIWWRKFDGGCSFVKALVAKEKPINLFQQPKNISWFDKSTKIAAVFIKVFAATLITFNAAFDYLGSHTTLLLAFLAALLFALNTCLCTSLQSFSTLKPAAIPSDLTEMVANQIFIDTAHEIVTLAVANKDNSKKRGERFIATLTEQLPAALSNEPKVKPRAFDSVRFFGNLLPGSQLQKLNKSNQVAETPLPVEGMRWADDITLSLV